MFVEVAPSSFVPQRVQRIDARRAQRRQITGDERRDTENCDRDRRRTVGRRHSEQQRLDKSLQREHRDEAERDAGTDEARAVTDNKPEDFTA